MQYAHRYAHICMHSHTHVFKREGARHTAANIEKRFDEFFDEKRDKKGGGFGCGSSGSSDMVETDSGAACLCGCFTKEGCHHHDDNHECGTSIKQRRKVKSTFVFQPFQLFMFSSNR